MPFISGNEMSRTTTSGASWMAIRNAVRPSRASPTMAKSGSAPIRAFRPASTTGWSSTIRIRTGPGVIRSSQRYAHVEGGAALFARLHFQAAAHQGEALADAQQPEVLYPED